MKKLWAIPLEALTISAGLAGGVDLVGQVTNLPSAREPLTPPRLLERYESTQRRLYRSFVSRFESDNEGYINRHTVLEPGRRKSRDVVEIRSDSQRHFWSEERSGQSFPRLSETTPATDPRCKWFLFDGHYCYATGHEPMWMIRQAVQKYKTSDRTKALNDRLTVTISDRLDPMSEFVIHFKIGDRQSRGNLPDSLGTGGLFQETGLIERLRKAQTLALEPNLELAGGVPCHVLKASVTEARTDAAGQKHFVDHMYRLHFDPAHDYHLAKLEVTVTHRDLPGEPKITGPYLVEKRTVDHVRFQQIGAAWVPMEWQRSYSARRLDNPQLYNWEKSKVRRTRVLLDSDHDALGSFKPTLIQDGWTIQLRGFGNRFDQAGPFAWKTDQVVDKAGQRIDLR